MGEYWLGDYIGNCRHDIEDRIDYIREKEELKEDEGEKIQRVDGWYLVTKCKICGDSDQVLERCEECGDLFCDRHIDDHEF